KIGLLVVSLRHPCLHAFIPGSGCQPLEDVVETTINPELSTTEYVESIREFIPGNATEKAAVQVKQCYLNQIENLSDVSLFVFQHAMYHSTFCALF
uniref:Uncharacterized protein n=1 Tax=Equus caballus TaxID=9796 RepID=A0A3Q2HDI4_HORSE